MKLTGRPLGFVVAVAECGWPSYTTETLLMVTVAFAFAAVMFCGVAEEPRWLLPSLSVAVTVHTPGPEVMVTTPAAMEHDPLAPIVRLPSPVEVAAGVYVCPNARFAGSVLVKVVVDGALVMVSVPLPLPW